ncbi:integrase core domain-containing protein [Deinococcus aerophilus]|uniref:integrase core domain-containing protein n=1 Tax=Deinococcus aerophilus TaxID=522488 RepID=UPI00166DDCE4
MGYPERIQVNSSEFVSKALDLWTFGHRVTLDFSRSGRPQDNAHIEPFNGSFRDECLNTHRFLSLEDFAEKIKHWRADGNTHAPRSALKNLAPGALQHRIHRPTTRRKLQNRLLGVDQHPLSIHKKYIKIYVIGTDAVLPDECQ